MAIPLLLALLLAAIQYDAPTDREPRPKPPLPEMGRAGTVIEDPTFGTRILRVTDARTSRSPCTSPGASLQNAWSADSKNFVVLCGGAVYPVELDVERLAARVAREPLELRSAGFSYSEPGLVYGVGTRGNDDRRIYEYSIRRRKYRKLLDLDEVVPRFPGHAGSVTASAGERIAAAFGGMQDTFRYVVVFDKKEGTRRLLDTRAATVDGKPAGFEMGFGIHLVNIDKSGRYVIVSKGQGGKKPNLMVWDTSTDKFGEVKPAGGGHYAAGYGRLVNGNGWFPTWAQWLLRPLAPTGLGEITKLIDPELPKDYGGREEHSSWANALPDRAIPVFVSVTRHAGAKNPLAPWDDEIIAISTEEGRRVVWRFAHHRSRYDRSDFWDLPRGNVSPDGRFFLFTSNWEQTLAGRKQDVFLLELPLR